MDRTQKASAVAEIKEAWKDVQSIVLAEYRGIDVPSITSMRDEFRKANCHYKVVKNTLARLAAKGTPLEKFTEHLDGPNAIILGYDDVVAPAKVLRDVLREQGEKMTVKAGVVQGNLVDAKGLAALADMPGLPELRGMLVGMIAAPATRLVRLLNTPGGQLARVLKAKSEKAA